MKVRTNQKSILFGLNELQRLVCDEGGAYIDSALELDIRGSDLSYRLNKKVDDQRLMIDLPTLIMPQIDHYEFKLGEKGELQIGRRSASAPKEQLAIMELSVELFNLMDKVNQFAKDSPAVQLYQYPELLKLLLKGGKGSDLAGPAEIGDSALKIAAFWQSRMFYEIESKVNRSLPLMEFMNHHLFANNFKYDFREGGTGVQLRHKNLVEGQTFARYEIMDALQTCVVYGFVDTNAYFLQSQEFTMPLIDGLTLQVSSQAVCSYQSDVPDWHPPPKYQNSFMYRSRLLYRDEGPIFPYGIVPPGSHMLPFKEAVSAQFEEIERHYKLASGVINNDELFLRYCKYLYSENAGFYKKLVASLKAVEFNQLEKGSSVPGQLKMLLRKQRGILKGFSKSLKDL